MREKDPKKQLEAKAVEANIELNEEVNDDYPLPTGKSSSITPTEVNLKLEEEFNGESEGTYFEPTFLYNNTPPIIITGEDERR